jgi:hypothetical protein
MKTENDSSKRNKKPVELQFLRSTGFFDDESYEKNKINNINKLLRKYNRYGKNPETCSHINVLLA